MVNYKGVARLAAKEAKGYQLLIYETGGVIGMVGREWAYGAQVDMCSELTAGSCWRKWCACSVGYRKKKR